MPARQLNVRQAVLDEMAAHARDEMPLECCGLLLGDGDVVDTAVRVRNARPSASRYLIDPADHFAALRLARAGGRQIVGAYHSHPASPPVPSPRDLAEAADPELVHVIVRPGTGGRPAEARAFRLAEGNFLELDLVSLP